MRLMRRHPARRRTAALAVLSAVTVATLTGGALTGTVSAQAASLPITYSFTAAFVAHAATPTQPPPGANDFNCHPSAAHPYPVVLVHGTYLNMSDTWQAASPLLTDHGYCVFSLNYGALISPADDFQGLGEISASAQQLATFVDQVLAATGAGRVDIVGHSQGGMMSRYYINFFGGAQKVDKLVGLAPPNYGTTIDGLINLLNTLNLLVPVNSVVGIACDACVEQEIGTPFLAKLNATPTVPTVDYTVIADKGDEVTTPYTNAFLPAAPNVTNLTVNDQCVLDNTEHFELPYDPVALADVLNALDPAHPVNVPCLPVLPLTGPVGFVPPF